MALERVFEMVFAETSSEEEDDEFVIRRPRWIRNRENHFDGLDDLDFITRFRLSKRSAMEVLEQIEQQLEFANDKNYSISPMNQLLCALRFYATGCHQLTAGDFSGFSKSAAHRIVHRVSCAIASLRPLYVLFPETDADIRKTQLGFYLKASFPNVVGAIDCTHVKLLKSPGGNHAELFRNRKGYFSLNVQAICNSELEFTDIVARWPGSVHDSNIFNNCYRKIMFEEGRYGDGVLVGDSGYACRKYMMTPLDNCRTRGEHLYNESQIRTRNPVERIFGVWKRRFPIMALGLNVQMENVFPIIIATVVLHNIARRASEEVPPDDPDLLLPAPWDVMFQNGYMGGEEVGQRRPNPNHRWRRDLINNYFYNLARGK